MASSTNPKNDLPSGFGNGGYDFQTKSTASAHVETYQQSSTFKSSTNTQQPINTAFGSLQSQPVPTKDFTSNNQLSSSSY
jgi:hypothetical protein